MKVAATFTQTSEATFTLSRPIKKRKKVKNVTYKQTNIKFGKKKAVSGSAMKRDLEVLLKEKATTGLVEKSSGGRKRLS